ncbi:putative bifunctional diguanylate cyclase/phosphodiesterase [Kineosporia succinea]|uniref:Diguanylate cyclase (GGDEF)-like protein n=1 Tax=Kineosporia succinea TaxID=84632 RepID=A0ABT9NYR1_9ACTN|nr:bifunctional diguanylate cyclase/phosphodiesterase [Kineosporia succinea]MDP9825269.1 diguanylate cyclase (GGDEF)-like protein [Kineosporia succinea]
MQEEVVGRSGAGRTGDGTAAGDQTPVRTTVLGLLVGFGVLIAAICPVLGATQGPVPSFGLWGSGLIAVLSGAVVARAGREPFRQLLGWAVVLWGTGQLMIGADLLDGAVAYPAVGDIVSALAAPLGVIALIRAPRSSRSDWPGVRLGLDALLLAAGLTLLVWRTMLSAPDDIVDAGAVVNGLICFFDLAIIGIVLLVCLRDTGCRLWPAVPGVVLHAVADVTGMLLDPGTAVGDRALHWQSMALWAIAWPLVAIGLIRYRRSNPTADSDSVRDRQEVVAAQVTVLLTAVTVVAGMLVGRHRGLALDPGTVLLLTGLGLLLLIRELTSAYLRLRLTERLRTQAFYDALTGLPNRRALIDRITELRHGTTPWAVLTLDIDGFKEMNDLLGQSGGDRLLVAAAGALREFASSDVTVARIGADEFALLAPGDLKAGSQLGDRVRGAVGAALERECPGAGLSASIGVGRLVRGDLLLEDASVSALGDGNRIEGLAESAAALAAAKASGRNSVEIYTGAVAASRERRLRLEQRLRLAIAAGSVHTVGQPIVDLTDGRLISFESLARWTDEELGPIPPDEFIAVAEQTGMVVALGEQLLSETLLSASEAGVFSAGLSVSVNASPIQLRAPGFVDLMRHHLTRLGIPPDRIVVEITEAILVDEGDPAIPVLAELRGLGVELAIDDFGTGYSALGYLRRLPVQVLKFDKSLTQSLNSEAKTVAIVDGVIRMSHRLGIRVVMEGIEEEHEAERCRAVAADRGQGWLYGRPMPWTQVAVAVAAQESSVRRSS